jgi:hypothetical protein
MNCEDKLGVCVRIEIVKKRVTSITSFFVAGSKFDDNNVHLTIK